MGIFLKHSSYKQSNPQPFLIVTINKPEEMMPRRPDAQTQTQSL